ncbi:hypothetical protein ACHAXA_009453 [Cyclostephanos tholiformis]|uniref:Methyltransferase domain-containing protein n=1 Tax=Cyclostephanos tholiformis TaxID=382380 RepID=A0ABD3RAM2_9STRA
MIPKPRSFGAGYEMLSLESMHEMWSLSSRRSRLAFACVASFLLALAATASSRGGGSGIVGRPLKTCEAILDDLDEEYDERRENRHKRRRGWRGVKVMFDLYEPEATCFREERFGASDSGERFDAYGDGPKFVCGVDLIAAKAKDGNADGCLVYSVGSNNDVQFEKAVHTHMGCEIHTFDPTLNKPFIGGMYSTFHPWGLGTDGGNEGRAANGRKDNWIRKSFETVINDLGHVNRTIDILKIDCEGCEYAAMPPLFDLISSGNARVNQIQIEMHARGTSPRSAKMIYDFFLAADRAKFRIIHKERNNWGCNGHRCVEYVFVSESFLRYVNGNVVCPEIGDI